MSRRLKNDVAAQLIAAIVPHITRNGIRDISTCFANTGALRARIGSAEVMYLQKVALLTKTPPPHLIDILIEGRGKVFSAWFDPIDIVSFHNGPWVETLLADLLTLAKSVDRRAA